MSVSDCSIYRDARGKQNPAGWMPPEWLYRFLRSGRVDPAPTGIKKIFCSAEAGNGTTKGIFSPGRSRTNTAMKNIFPVSHKHPDFPSNR